MDLNSPRQPHLRTYMPRSTFKPSAWPSCSVSLCCSLGCSISAAPGGTQSHLHSCRGAVLMQVCIIKILTLIIYINDKPCSSKVGPFFYQLLCMVGMGLSVQQKPFPASRKEKLGESMAFPLSGCKHILRGPSFCGCLSKQPASPLPHAVAPLKVHYYGMWTLV